MTSLWSLVHRVDPGVQKALGDRHFRECIFKVGNFAFQLLQAAEIGWALIPAVALITILHRGWFFGRQRSRLLGWRSWCWSLTVTVSQWNRRSIKLSLFNHALTEETELAVQGTCRAAMTIQEPGDVLLVVDPKLTVGFVMMGPAKSQFCLPKLLDAQVPKLLGRWLHLFVFNVQSLQSPAQGRHDDGTHKNEKASSCANS